MNKNSKQMLKTAFMPPPPQRKEAFLHELPYPKSSLWDFLKLQLHYIRKRVWAVYLLSAVCAIALAGTLQGQTMQNSFGALWVITALLPAVVLLTIGEVYRSGLYGMAELEMSCKYSLAQATMAKMTMLGACTLVLLPVFIGACYYMADFNLLQAAAYILVPYLTSCAGAMAILHRFRTQEGMYGCAALAVLIAFVQAVAERVLYHPQNLWLWITVCAGCMLCITLQVKKHIKESKEAAQWSL